MRRWVAPGLVLVGTALLVFGFLAWVWIGPAVHRAPTDEQKRTVSLGSGSYYDLEAGEQVQSNGIRSVLNTQSDQSVYEGDDPISDDIAVYDQTSGLFDDETDHEITYSEQRVAIDRVTALPVDCCGADAIEGLTVKWPFDVQQESYEVWDSSIGQAVTANFTGEDEIEGLPVYVFDVEIPVTDAGPATEDAEFPRLEYEASKRYFVEPVTGRIISSQQDVRQSVIGEDGETLFDAADVSVEVSPETVADNLAIARDQTSQLGLIDLLTWLAPLIGVVLLAVGLVLGLRAPQPAAARQPEPVGAP